MENANKPKEIKGLLKNWIVSSGMVFGNVYGHPDFQDGEYIRTSAIVVLQKDRVETRNSIYMLEVVE